jgi:predicted nucleic acid-binding protein
MLLVDTNIIALFYIHGAYTERAQELHRFDNLWRTDPLALVEFSNVLATYQRARYLTANQARMCLAEAERFLRPHYLQVTHETSLTVAIRYGVTTYDARFLAAAMHLNTRLVTEDKKLRGAAPNLTQSLADALAGS